jgi:8-oxo-dGTP pyrophosphatase MutT (NUDIX family)
MSDARATVLGVLPRPDSDELLVQRLDLPVSEPFYRAIGGGIHDGETSAAAVEREFREELGVEVSAGEIVGTVENVFQWDGESQTEVVVLRRVSFEDESLYERDRFHGVDAGGSVEYEATWETLAELRARAEPLYPEGIDAILSGDGGGGRGHLVSPDATN